MVEKFTEEMTIFEAAEANPEARGVVEKYFGKACFQCPSFYGEPLFLGARMHAVDLEKLLKDLNSTL
ncbi:MAG TPA: disulfide oxidoreductase [archaeon]|nr:disulfide oxidoreductase [archaeon]